MEREGLAKIIHNARIDRGPYASDWDSAPRFQINAAYAMADAVLAAIDKGSQPSGGGVTPVYEAATSQPVGEAGDETSHQHSTGRRYGNVVDMVRNIIDHDPTFAYELESIIARNKIPEQQGGDGPALMEAADNLALLVFATREQAEQAAKAIRAMEAMERNGFECVPRNGKWYAFDCFGVIPSDGIARAEADNPADAILSLDA